MNGRTPFFSWKPLSRLARKTLRNTSNAEALTITEPSNPRPSRRQCVTTQATPPWTSSFSRKPRAAARGSTRTRTATSTRSRPWWRTTPRTRWPSRCTSLGCRCALYPTRHSPRAVSRTTSSSRRTRTSATSSTTRSPSCRCTRRGAPRRRRRTLTRPPSTTGPSCLRSA